MADILKDAPAYRWMTEEAREEERQAREEERRQIVIEIVEGRFGKLVRLAKKQGTRYNRCSTPERSDY